METQVKTQGTATPEFAGRTSTSPSRLPGYILRAVAAVLTLLATIVMGAARQSGTISVPDNAGGTALADATVKSTYSAAFVYFIIANVFAFVYSVVSLGMSVVGLSNLDLPFTVADLVMVVFLFSSNGAAAAISVVAEKGQSQLGWDKICNLAGKFCKSINASIVLSMAASVAYLLLLLFAIFGLHRRAP